MRLNYLKYRPLCKRVIAGAPSLLVDSLTKRRRIYAMDLMSFLQVQPSSAITGTRFPLLTFPALHETDFSSRALGRDPTVFPDPEVFRPSRWLTESGTMREDMKFYNFGFGRRYVLFLTFYLLDYAEHDLTMTSLRFLEYVRGSTLRTGHSTSTPRFCSGHSTFLKIRRRPLTRLRSLTPLTHTHCLSV